MTLSRIPVLSVVAGVLALAIACGGRAEEGGGSAGGGGGGGSSSGAVVSVDGSSTVFPLSEAVAEEFQQESRDTRVTVASSGTGGGFQKFCNGEIQVAGASRPISPSEVQRCAAGRVEFVELPVAYDGLAVVVNPQNSWAESMTVAELRTLWAPEAQNRIRRWNQVRQGWPDEEIHLFGAGVDSGTYDYFTKAIVGREHASRGDYTSSEDDNVLVQGVATDRLALGFLPYAYVAENLERLRVVGVDDEDAGNGAGPIRPSPETVANGTYQPLSRPIFIYVSKRALDRPEVARFAEFYVENAAELAPDVGYVALPARAYTLDSERLRARTVGSIFGGEGSQVGVTVDQLLEREASR
jgi:phosphate transport system substrate-binding protein